MFKDYAALRFKQMVWASNLHDVRHAIAPCSCAGSLFAMPQRYAH